MTIKPGFFVQHIEQRLSRVPSNWRWALSSLIIALICISPLIAIFFLALNPSDNIWPHLFRTVLADYVLTTLGLMIGVGLMSVVIGTGTAWLTTMCRFRGRGLLQWLLLLPLVMPTYIIAFTYVDVFEFSGPVQAGLREVFGWQSRADYWFPEIRSLGGAIFVMSFVLYPYVFLTARASFMQQSICVLDISRTLGRSSWGSFYSIALPLARPAIAIGTALVLMECLNDIGTVEFFGVRTLTAGIYTTWLSQHNLGGAAQIACVLLVFVLALVYAERLGRRRGKIFHTSNRYQEIKPYELTGWRMVLAGLACFLPVGIGFAVPGYVLVKHSLAFYPAALNDSRFFEYMINSLTLSVSASCLALVVGLALAYGNRQTRTPLISLCTRIASIGYAVPGAILGIGILIPLARFDNMLDGFMNTAFGVSTGLLLSGSSVAIVIAYVIRFLALSYGTVETGLQRITPSVDMAARTLGQSSIGALRRVHLPMISPTLLTAALLVFVDSMKELPATLILRPFNFDTLATHVYTLASLELLEESAFPALVIVLTGLIPVILLTRSLILARPGDTRAFGPGPSFIRKTG